MKKGNKIYHVEFKEPVNGKKHHYFGSQAAIYDTFTSEQMGITQRSLYNHKDLENEPYENKKCIIRFGELKRKAGNRGKRIN